MALGLRTILLIAAVAIFVIAVFVDNPTDWWSIGLACTAGAFLAESLGWADRTVGSMSRRT
jgi:predicted membrane metal-binding protein